MAKNIKEKVRKIIVDLTQGTPSIFSDTLIQVAGEFDIWESDLKRTLKELKEENFIEETCTGVIRRLNPPLVQ